MITLVYKHKQTAMWNKFSAANKGLLGYDKSNKTFSCEDSDLQCAGIDNGIADLSNQFMLEIDENKHTRIFKYSRVEKDDEGDIQYWEWKSKDGFTFIVFND